jgi:hypothetical protein
VNSVWWRGVRRACPERSRGNPEGAYLAHAVRSFSTTEAREQDLAAPVFELFFPSDGCANVFLTLKVEQALAAIGRSETFQRALLMLHDAQIQVAGDANVKRACLATENVDVAPGHSKMLAVLVVGPGERSWRARQVRASVVEKLRTAWVR